MADINQQQGFQNGNQQMGYINANQSFTYPNNIGTPTTSINGRNAYSGNPYMVSTNPQYDNYMNQNRNAGMMNMPSPQVNNSQFQNNQFFKCRPVSSEEEARASQIDLDGSLWVFTDIGNKKMYTKQINNDGTATFKIYKCIKDENPYSAQQQPSSKEYVTRE